MTHNEISFEEFRSGIGFQASNLVGNSPAETSFILQSLIKICASLGKQELTITNIVPGIRLGKDDLSAVPEIQDRIVALLENAFIAQKRLLPSNRLVIRRGEFGIQFYLDD